ncbi:hypothetical protein HX021_16785 [Sphingobacterium sp. N143]|uniref:hypothetical protein n=1 Tax=Sphingobacterium sp. N143 TaxID=2746727 RepID=UPI002576337F|nr:hypothetical protein [Sphingobacterium sp. N143]MDM1295949.1 hypothetical protein [Sphingobacterium sp. N143]
MQIDLNNKNILFIAPIFYNYHEIIKAELERLGANVYFVPERDYSFKFTIVNNFFPNKLEKLQANHYRAICRKFDHIEFDYLFVIKGFKMSLEFLDLFKERYPAAIKIMHQWDSEKNNPFSHLIDKFDRVFSFDYEDIAKYPNLVYLPNFYLSDIYLNDKYEYQYDILFLVSYLPERYHIMSKLQSFADKHQLKLKAILIMPFTTYVKDWFKGKRYDRSIIKFSPLSRADYLALFWRSKIIFDMGSSSQTGMSQRTIETIESGKKLLTNNYYVKQDIIFNKDQIFVTSGEFSEEILDFMNSPFEVKPTGYSIEMWINKLFG